MAFANPVQIIPYFELRPGMDIADFGAGEGAYIVPMAEKVSPNGKIFAIDVQKELLVRLKNSVTGSQQKNIEYLWGDIEAPAGSKITDGHMDLVLISNVLFLSKAQYSIAKEAFRVLKSGGRAIVIDWTDSFSGLGPHPNDVVPAEAAKKIFEQAGFQFAKDFPAGDHHYGIIFNKL